MCEYVLHGRVSCQVTVVTGTCVSRALSVSCLCRLPRSGASLCLLSRDSSVSDERARRREGAVCGLRLIYVTTTMWPCVLKRMRPLCHPVILPPSQPLRSPHHSHIRHRQHITSAPRHSALSRRVCRPCHIFNVSSHPSAHTRRFLFQCCPSFPTTPVARHLFCSSSNWPDQRVCAGRAHSVTSRARSLSQRSESRRRASR